MERVMTIVYIGVILVMLCIGIHLIKTMLRDETKEDDYE